MKEGAYIAKLIAARQGLADNGLGAPSEKTAFEFGRQCGVNQGLRRAEELYLELLKEQDKRDI